MCPTPPNDPGLVANWPHICDRWSPKRIWVSSNFLILLDKWREIMDYTYFDKIFAPCHATPMKDVWMNWTIMMATLCIRYCWWILIVHGLASFVQQKSKIGGHSNPFGGSSITYVGSVCHQSRVIWSWGAHSALTSWSRWFYTVKWSKLAIFSGLSGRFLGVVWWFQSFLQVRTCLYLDDLVKFWKKIQPGWRRTPKKINPGLAANWPHICDRWSPKRIWASSNFWILLDKWREIMD